MNERTTPVPKVCISTTFSYDSEIGKTAANVVIDVSSADVGCGFVVLDEISDILLLKAAIDNYITVNNIQPLKPIDNEQEEENQ